VGRDVIAGHETDTDHPRPGQRRQCPVGHDADR
jgi:hypothetical protein